MAVLPREGARLHLQNGFHHRRRARWQAVCALEARVQLRPQQSLWPPGTPICALVNGTTFLWVLHCEAGSHSTDHTSPCCSSFIQLTTMNCGTILFQVRHESRCFGNLPAFWKTVSNCLLVFFFKVQEGIFLSIRTHLRSAAAWEGTVIASTEPRTAP